MTRSQAIAAILCAAVLAAISIQTARYLMRQTAPTPLGPEGIPSQTSAQGGDGAATNAAPAGAFVGKDKLVYVNYGTRDPALQSFIRALMDGSYDTTAKGRAIFLKVCAACHQPDGMGKEGVAPPLVGSEWVLEDKGDRLVRIVLNGLGGPVQVRGRQWNMVMPPWRENLKDDEIAVVLTYIRSKVGGNKAGPIKPESVGAARMESHPGPETAAELLKLSNE
ncbi:MAG TPA: cytochrome c [Candidatus Baltobacteraceae bacterium]|jgi:mono/diheme cytochrome c family protein|nr:cytochrome c [Candidatus Baltobacteraceae bacterium]